MSNTSKTLTPKATPEAAPATVPDVSTDPALDPATVPATAAVSEAAPAHEPEVTEGASPNAEAAKYRRQLRDVEADRDQLASTVLAFQRAEAEALAGEVLVKGSDLWLIGTELTDLLSEDGRIDPAKVTAAIEGALSDRPYMSKRNTLLTGNTVPREGGNPHPVATEPSWGDAFDQLGA